MRASRTLAFPDAVFQQGAWIMSKKRSHLHAASGERHVLEILNAEVFHASLSELDACCEDLLAHLGLVVLVVRKLVEHPAQRGGCRDMSS